MEKKIVKEHELKKSGANTTYLEPSKKEQNIVEIILNYRFKEAEKTVGVAIKLAEEQDTIKKFFEDYVIFLGTANYNIQNPNSKFKIDIANKDYLNHLRDVAYKNIDEALSEYVYSKPGSPSSPKEETQRVIDKWKFALKDVYKSEWLEDLVSRVDKEDMILHHKK